MHRILTLASLLAGLGLLQAQERLSREESLKYAFLVTADLTQLVGTPLTTDPDVKRPVVVRDGEYGAMLLPESKLTAEQVAKAGKEPTAVGQLWLHKLAPLGDGQVVPEAKLRMVTVSGEGGSATVPQCALGISKTESGGLELLVFGKGKEPVLKAPLKEAVHKIEGSADLLAEKRDDGGLLTIRLCGKYEASFMVTDPDRY